MGASYNPPSSAPVGNNNYNGYITSPINMPNASMQIIEALVIPVAGTYVITGTLYAENQVVEAGVLDIWLAPNSVTLFGIYVSTTVGVGGVEGRNAHSPVQLVTVQQITAGQTVYLMAEGNTPNITINSNSFLENAPNASGIEAWRIF